MHPSKMIGKYTSLAFRCKKSCLKFESVIIQNHPGYSFSIYCGYACNHNKMLTARRIKRSWCAREACHVTGLQ